MKMHVTSADKPTKTFLFIFLIFIISLAINLFYTLHLPWGGDEWYTYQGQVMAVPNTVLVSIAKAIMGGVSVHNYFWYRQVGLMWLMFAYGVLALRYIKSQATSAFFLFCFLALNSFTLFQVQYFRYYGMYLFFSIAVFISLYQLDPERYAVQRKWIYLWLLVSPLVHFFLFWQVLVFIVITEMLLMKPTKRLIAIGGITLIILAFFALRVRIFDLALRSFGAIAQGDMMRGFNVGLLVKPFYSMFQFAFGYDLEPTENTAIFVLYVSTLVLFVVRLFILKKENPRAFVTLFTAGLMPFFLMFWAVEPLTPLGSTQFESKHGLFFFPFFISAFIPECREKRQLKDYLPFVVLLCASILGLITSLSVERPDWNRVVSMASDVQGKGGVILVDGRSRETFLFYGKGRIDSGRVRFIYDSEALKLAASEPIVMLIMNDYKSYQELGFQQMWNTGTGSTDRYQAISRLFDVVREKKGCSSSYCNYPLLAYVYEGDVSSERERQPRPAFFGIPYQDIRLPIMKDNVSIYGWEDVTRNNQFLIDTGRPGTVSLYYFIEAGKAPEGLRIGRLDFEEGNIPLVIGKKPTNTYQAVYSRGLAGADEWYTWKKRPVYTQSLRYPGSLLNSTGHIYHTKLNLPGKGRIIIEDPDVIMHLCAFKAEAEAPHAN